MIIYLLDQQKTPIASLLSQKDIILWQKPQDSGNIEIWDQQGINPLDRVDALVLEITEPTSQSNYLLAQSILMQKNTLCLYKKARSPRQLLAYLHNKNVPKSIEIKAYTDNTLKDLVFKFIRNIKPDLELEEKPHIKYTLRITDYIDKYLDYKSKVEKIDKASYIRNLIKKQAQEDKGYNKKI